MVTPIYLINLDQSTDRLAQCDKLLQQHGLEYERVSAVLGKGLSDVEIDKYYDAATNRKKYYRTLSKGEIGCYLSHRECWRRIVHSDAPYGVVLEDDITIIGDVKKAIGQIERVDFDWDLIKLAPYNRKTRKVVLRHQLDQEAQLVIHSKPMSGCAATIYSKQGAERLLNATEQFYRPVDTDIQHFWEKGIEVWSLAPYVFQQNLDSESTITATRKYNTKRHWVRKVQQISEFFNNRKAVKKQVKSYLNRQLTKKC